MLRRGAIVLLAVWMVGGGVWAAPQGAEPRPVIQLDVLIARLPPDVWSGFKGPLRRSVVPVVVQGDPKGSFAGVLPREQGGITAFVEKLQDKGLAKSITRPRHVTRSGEPTIYFDGDERAMPVPSGTGSVGVQFAEIGTRLYFLPILLGNGRIHLEVEPEVSMMDTNAGRTTLRIHTTVELEAGQTFVIGGITQRDTVTQQHTVPVLSALPFVGDLFRWETTRVGEEYKILILVTPMVFK